MGTLLGHVLPGTFFFIFGCIGLFDGFKRYFHAAIRGKNGYSSRTCTKYRYRDRKTNMYKNIPLESWIKLFASLIGIAGEIVTGLSPEGELGAHNSQHCVMYCLFGVQSIVEIIVLMAGESKNSAKMVLPPDLDYIFGAVAFGGESLLFYWHLHGRNQLDIYVHTLLVYGSLACTLFTILELVKRRNFSVFLLRSGSTILQGTWFFHVGLILYPISESIHWDPNSHRDLMLIPIYFILHVLSIFTFIGIIGLTFYKNNKDKLKNARYAVLNANNRLLPLTSSSDSDTMDLNL
ncbi:transmembrane protein 45B isoform X2 [Lepeophtheirus salmonis]|uniref:transmembrane protein 45B isoform X2 n=1 Tax=Lepeophtheirus salmonis TaxID=72036 RepID=UPI001AE57840|nr:transmembrane protein 45B-like isoform X2 [Lepeophtheirus salmonis]